MNQPNGPTIEGFEKALKDAETAVAQWQPPRPQIPIVPELADPGLDIEALVLSAWIAKILQENKQDFRPTITAKDARLLNIAMDAVLRRMPR